MREFLDKQRLERQEKDKEGLVGFTKTGNYNTGTAAAAEQIKEVGAKIKVKWSAEEIGDSGWQAGWYKAIVQGYDDELDEIIILYPSEPGCTYTLDLSKISPTRFLIYTCIMY